MSGGPSHLETFDFKPELARRTGEPMPKSFTKGQPIAHFRAARSWRARGRCLILPATVNRARRSAPPCRTSRHCRRICIVRSMVTEAINHDPAHTFMNTGTTISGRPSMGSWLTYGLGSEATTCRGLSCLTSFAGRSPQPISNRMLA